MLSWLWLPYGIGKGHYIFALWFLSFFFAEWILPYFYTWCGFSANLECRSELCCTRLAGNTRCKNHAKNRHIGTIAQLCRAVSSQLSHVSTIGKNLLSSNTSSTCPCNMVKRPTNGWDPLGIWGTPANFNGFLVLALTARHSSSGRQPDFVALNRGRHLYSAGGHHVGHWSTF